MMPTRIFSVAMMIFPLYFQVDGDDAHNRERRTCCEDNNLQDALVLKSHAKGLECRFYVCHPPPSAR